MKKLLLVAACYLCTPGAYAQIAFYDAKTIRNDLITITGDSINFKTDAVSVSRLSILLKAHLSEELKNNPNLTEAQIFTLYKTNPFFGGAITKLLNAGASAEKVGLVPGISSLGSLNVTNLADGIARFLIKRGKEELNVAFFNRMKEFLEDPKHPECKILFPVTTEFLGQIATYRYAELLQSLREAFYKDLSNLIVSLNQLIDHPKYRELLKNLPEIRAAVRCSKIVNELSQSEKGILPDSLIHELAGLPELQELNSNLGNSLKLLDIFSLSIREKADANISANSEQRRWIQLSDLNNLVKDQIALKIFIGLVYQKVHMTKIQFTINNKPFMVDSFIAENAPTIHVVSGLIENFAVLANDVDRTIKDSRDKLAKGTLSNDDYYSYINKAINITEYGFKVANIIQQGIIDDYYIIMARNANDLYKNIYTKNYNNAVMNAYTILDQAFNNRDKLVDQKITDPTLKKSLKTIEVPKSEIIEKFLKYGNFMASVVKAESGEDVQNALEAAALPAGSFSIKQKSAFNVSVNGYIGYAWDFKSGLYAHGIYAPVGISMSRGSRYKRPSLSAFASLIDVGGIAAYRLENGVSENLKQEVRLESIFSPSFQLFVEPIHGFPLAIGGGWRRTPKLFYTDNTALTVVTSKSVINLSLLIDIPIFNIINRQYFIKQEKNN